MSAMASAGFRDYLREAKLKTGLPYVEMARRAGMKEGRMREFTSGRGELSPVEQHLLQRVIDHALQPMNSESSPVAQLRPSAEGPGQPEMTVPLRPEDIARIRVGLLEEVRDARRERTKMQDELYELRVRHDALELRVEALEGRDKREEA